jgi:hypothetical protein
MTWTRTDWILWTPRVLSVVFSCLIPLFALDVFVEGRPPAEILAALLIHLIPTCVLLILLALAWRRPWIGAIGYGALAVAYTTMAWRHPAWVALIAGPLLVIAVLFWLSWRASRKASAQVQ